jgi:hypothetical protein
LSLYSFGVLQFVCASFITSELMTAGVCSLHTKVTAVVHASRVQSLS